MNIVFELTIAHLDLKTQLASWNIRIALAACMCYGIEMQQFKCLIHTNHCQLFRLEMQKLAGSHQLLAAATFKKLRLKYTNHVLPDVQLFRLEMQHQASWNI
jgi:hypothetical protein